MAIAGKTTQEITLSVQPRQVLADEIVTIKVTGCSAGQKVTLCARSCDDSQELWLSSATFIADATGEISLHTHRPVSGTYRGIDPRGLFWSMRPAHKKQKIPFMINATAPIVIEVSAEIDNRRVAATEIEIVFSSPDIIRVPVREHGLVGTFYHPAGPGPYPTVLLLSGSDAAICNNQASLLASHGYAVFTLAYFGHEELPDYLVDIPVEYFERAIQWMQQQDVVDENRLASIGMSRGAEVALLLATLFPVLKVVVAGSPSSHLHIGFAQNDYSRAAWTYRGKPLPHLKATINLFTGIDLLFHSLKHRGMALRSLFSTTLQDDENLAEAAIPVEKIQGAVLLISGQDDQLWPSSVFAELVMQRLTRHNHPYPYKHLDYQKAGHFVCFPYGYPSLPPLVGSQRGMACGGKVDATAHAIADSWEKILTFLQQNLQDLPRTVLCKTTSRDM